MARRKRPDDGDSGGLWLNTYADMVTLLLTFFILLFSISSLDAAKFNMLVKAFASDVDSSDKIIIRGEGEGDDQSAKSEGMELEEDVQSISDMLEALREYIEKNELGDSILLAEQEGQILIRFADDLLFEPNSAALKEGDKQILDFVGMAIKSVEDNAELININGFTAAIPDDPDYAVSDRTLSTDRANAVLQRFEDVIKIDPTKLMASGWGKHKPIASNMDEAGRSQNRRVEILISGENLLSDQLDQLYEKLVD